MQGKSPEQMPSGGLSTHPLASPLKGEKGLLGYICREWMEEGGEYGKMVQTTERHEKKGQGCLLLLALDALSAGRGLGLMQEAARPCRIWRFKHLRQNRCSGRLQKAAPR